MKLLKRNLTHFWYALYDHTATIDEDGNPCDPRIVYQSPVKAIGNVAHATGQAVSEAFGLLPNYDNVIALDGVDTPISETTVLWLGIEPDASKNGSDYNYIVVRGGIAKSLNFTMIAASKVVINQ